MDIVQKMSIETSLKLGRLDNNTASDVEDRYAFLDKLQETQDGYFSALDKLSSAPKSSLQGCLDLFLASSDLSFKDEANRSRAVIGLGQEILRLMETLRSIL